MTVSDLKEKLQTGDQSIANKILYSSASLLGTSQYWNQRSKVLKALIQFKINEGHSSLLAVVQSSISNPSKDCYLCILRKLLAKM